MRAFIVIVSSLILASSADAAIQRFRLHDHPDGNAQDPVYGFRLDDLLTAGVHTFSFDQPGAEMFLDYDSTANTIRIHGTAYGGLDAGSDWDTDFATLWGIDFTYTENVSEVGNGDDFIVTPDDPANFGTITALAATDEISLGESYNLVDYQGGFGYSFKFNDIDHHRISAGPDNDGRYVGWGWVNHSDDDHIAASDWLFTAEIIPEPTTFVVWSLLGLTASGTVRRRRLI